MNLLKAAAIITSTLILPLAATSNANAVSCGAGIECVTGTPILADIGGGPNCVHVKINGQEYGADYHALPSVQVPSVSSAQSFIGTYLTAVATINTMRKLAGLPLSATVTIAVSSETADECDGGFPLQILSVGP